MLRQNTNQTFMQVSLALLLSLCSLSAFSEGTRYLSFSPKFYYQDDSYTLRVVKKQCVKSATPDNFTVGPLQDPKIKIIYYKTINLCDTHSSYVEYEVRGVKRYDHIGYFRWIKYPGRAPKIEIDPGMNPLGLVKIYSVNDFDDGHGEKLIMMVVGYKGHYFYEGKDAEDHL